MALIQKTLFSENLDKYNTFVQDTEPNSRYFNITELPDTFTGGKNAFLIAGTPELVADTLIKIEIKDAAGNIIYHEPGEGMISSSVNGEPFVTEYFEGVSKVVSVYVYPETAYGPCTLTILGELSEYDNNGLLTPIPVNWQGQYNVKWQKTINVNPTLANTTKIRFYKRPTASISEILSPIYLFDITGSKVASPVTQSFANIKLSNLETFAGDVKRIKVFRTSIGDISDYDMIQDILVESKELLTTTQLSGSVVGNTGIFTSETLKNFWNTGSLNTELTSSRIESGLKLNGSGLLTYSQSLDLKSANTYELNLDAFYSSSTASNLGIYISGSDGGNVLISTLNGITPTKNLSDTVIPFKLDSDFESGSLYFSQSQGQWHLGNISLKLSQDTAFSPDEVSFVTTMPTVLGNETFNFKFEFYDVNNNYVPVAVTQSVLFNGGNNNVGGTLIYISSSASSSLAQLNAVSSSISGTATLYSSSANTTIVTLSGSVSSSITTVSGSVVTLSGSVSGSITTVSSSVVTLSGSVSASITSLSSSVSSSNAIILSSSFAQVKSLADGNYSGSFIGDTVIYSPAIGGQVGFIKELFTVGDTTAATINLDARTSTRKIYIGTGTYNNANTSIYLDSSGQFSLKDKLTFDTSGNLSVNGSINVTGGNAATQTYATTIGTNAVASGSASANAAQTAAQLFATSAAGRAVDSGSASATAAQTAAIAQAKSDASSSVNLLANGNWTAGTGTFITANSISSPVIAGNGGYISTIFRVGQNGITLDGTNKKIFVGTGTYNNANTPFYFASGSTDVFSLGNKLTWDGTTLGITGNITVSGGNAALASDVTTAQTTATNAANAASTAQTAATNAANAAAAALQPGGAASDVNSNSTSISGGKIRTGIIESTGFAYTSGDFSTTGTQINLDNGLIRSKKFTITSAGDALFKGSISGGTIAIGANFSVDASGNMIANNASMTGTVTATTGQIGGWTISGTALEGSGSAGKIILDPSVPSVKFNNAAGATKLTIRTGQLSYLGGNQVYVQMPSQNVGNAVYTTSTNFLTVGTATSTYFSTAGNFIGTPTYSGNGTQLITAYANFYGYFAIQFSIVIKNGSNYNTAATIGYISVGSADIYGSGPQTGDLAIYPYQQTISIPSAGTYYFFPTVDVYGSFNGTIQTSQGGYSGNNIQYDPELDFGELTEEGLQIASSADKFTKISRGYAYALETRGPVYLESGTINGNQQFNYCNGVWHPYGGNTNDLGTTGNRWRTVWTNNALNSTSDARLKNSIEDTDLGLEFVNKLRPVKYKNNAATSPRYHYGLIAQEMIGTLNDFNKTTSDVGFIASSSFSYDNEDVEKWKTEPDWESREREISASMQGELGLAYTELISPMIKAIQELSDRVIYLESKVSGSI